MDQSILSIIKMVILVSWPFLYYIIWLEFGDNIPRKIIRYNTLFYVSRKNLWRDIFREIVICTGSVMTLLNALVYSILYYMSTDADRAGEKILLIYLFLFGACFNILFTSLTLCKHCFTKGNKSRRYRVFSIVRMILILLQFLILDGYILAVGRFSNKIQETKLMSYYGITGYIVELAILFLSLILAYLLIKMARRLFFVRDFDR